jgi:drug/metabolite transporter (DMT)-like permease
LKKTFLPGALFCLNNVLFFFAIQHASVTNITLLVSLQPVVVILLAKPLFKENVTRFDVICTLIALGGAAFAILGANSGGKTTRTTLLGTVIALCSMLAFCGYFLLSKYENARNTTTPPHPLAYMTGIITAAAITSAPFMLLTSHLSGVVHLTAKQAQGLAWVVVVPTVGHLSITFAHRHVEASLSSLMLLIQPMTSAFVAWWLLGQRIVVQQLIDASIVIGAIAAVTLRRRSLTLAASAALASAV